MPTTTVIVQSVALQARELTFAGPAQYNDMGFLAGAYAAKVSTMRKTEALKLLKAHKSALTKKFGVIRLALFGSTVRDSAGPKSDIDILVTFDGPATSARYFGVQFYLEDLLGQSVDLVTDKALREELRPYIEREAVNV
jgi:predicted nucleotidyltransferase